MSESKSKPDTTAKATAAEDRELSDVELAAIAAAGDWKGPGDPPKKPEPKP